MGREFELKYTASEEIQKTIAANYQNFRQIRMETTYFDTPDGALSARKMTLRLRKENDLTICTLKTPLPDGSRGEWECQATDIQSGIATLLTLGAPDTLHELTARGVIAVCGARFIRLAAEVSTADGCAELALDRGVLLGGSKEQPLCEIEVELKSGSDTACLAFAAQLAETYGLKVQSQSKFRRALALAKGE